jgi:hypothetical protein
MPCATTQLRFGEILRKMMGPADAIDGESRRQERYPSRMEPLLSTSWTETTCPPIHVSFDMARESGAHIDKGGHRCGGAAASWLWTSWTSWTGRRAQKREMKVSQIGHGVRPKHESRLMTNPLRIGQRATENGRRSGGNTNHARSKWVAK